MTDEQFNKIMHQLKLLNRRIRNLHPSIESADTGDVDND